MENKLRDELAESRLEIFRLKERLASVMPTMHKDLSLISLVPKWSGSESSTPLEEFSASIESAARIGNWNENDCREIFVLGLQDPAKSFYNSNFELHAEGVTWEAFKSAFRNRFKNVRTDQYHFTMLQNARQQKNESPQDFADRCRNLAHKTMYKTKTPLRKEYIEKTQSACA